MIHLTLPYPISSNRYWAVRVIPRKPKPLAITCVTEDAKAYKAAVGHLAKAAGIRTPSTGRVGLYIKLFPHRPQDWAKRARNDPLTWDDKQIRRTLLERMEPDEHGARLEVAIEYLAPAPSLFGEAAA
ncbi:RusA family crossover junction endodeoxyribonuclease [Stenotrophomonas maltophilia]|nr:RusA family crossover junction endodeoxyribonuclease [Stenotrophomonas maltophilia]